MTIDGNIHCLFEQSGTFKGEFTKLGYTAYDYDIKNNFGKTDFIIDLFSEIEKGYDGKPSIFDNFTPDDLLMAFFPCIYFCDAKTMTFRGVSIWQKTWNLEKIMKYNITISQKRQIFYTLLLKLVCIAEQKRLRLIIENPWNVNGVSYLQNNFIQPTIIDHNRNLRGDYYVKPTAYWFIGCKANIGQVTLNATCLPK